jgi:predicted enzyme related to lactoylglutathione lyase
MTIRQNVRPGAACWVDLMSSDPEKSKAFYGGLLGWTAEEPSADHGGYTNLLLDGERVAGLMQAEPDMGASDVWSVYLCVDDAAATVQAARDAGSDVIVDAMAVDDLGTMAVVTDPGGAVIGLWQPGTHRGGVVGGEGAPCHFELHTRDYDAAVGFYRSVFGWNPDAVGDEDDFRYTVLADMPPGEGAGIMDASGFLPEGVPAHWSVYFSVPNVGDALARAEQLGGSVVTAAEATPYGVLATAADTTGALFKLRGEA